MGRFLFFFLAQGYFCCKRRVLEFEEFLKIEGCAEGRHLFVRKSRGEVVVRDNTRDELTIICFFTDIGTDALPFPCLHSKRRKP